MGNAKWEMKIAASALKIKGFSAKEPLINSAAHLAVPFPPCELANFLTCRQQACEICKFT